MNEKKKLIVLSVLAAMMIGVGAFQFIPKPPPAAPVVVTEDGAGTDEAGLTAEGEGLEEGGEFGLEGEPAVRNAAGGLVAALSPRDPFEAPAELSSKKNLPATPETPSAPAPQESRPAPRNNPSSSGNQPYFPGDFAGLSGFGGGTVVPTSQPDPEPRYRVKGVLVGARPIAVFEDESGNQRLVPLGGSIDGDTKVTAIERGKVTVSRRGKETTLVIQEEARND